MSPDQNTTSEDPTAYEDFVKREEEDFKKSKGCASIKYEDFFTHQVTLLDEKTKEVVSHHTYLFGPR